MVTERIRLIYFWSILAVFASLGYDVDSDSIILAADVLARHLSVAHLN